MKTHTSREENQEPGNKSMHLPLEGPEKDNLFNECCQEKQISTYRKIKLDPDSYLQKINSNWIIDLKVRLKL